MITPYGELPDRFVKDMPPQEQHEWLRRQVSRRGVVTASLLGASAMLSPSLWQQRDSPGMDGPQLRGRHVTFGSDPTSSLIVEFATVLPVQHASVRLTEGRGGVVRVATASIRMVRGSTHRYCRAAFAGLRSDFRYGYDIATNGRTIGRGTAITAFDDHRPFRFTAFGDQGIGPHPRAVLARLEALKPRFHLMCGDLCYADSSGLGGPGDLFRPRRWDAWLKQNDPAMSHIPWLSVPGNHEMEPGFATHGYAGFLTRVAPGGHSPVEVPVATTARIGNVAVVGLDSNDVSYEIPANRGWTHGGQTKWLQRTLAGYRAAGSGIDHIVVFMHHAPYSTNNTHASEGGIIQSWVPLFDRYAVDLVISGHNHCYERTKPLRGGAVVGDGLQVVDSSAGTTYITAGGGGEGGEARFIPYPGKTRVAYADGEEVVKEDWSLPTKTAVPSILAVDVMPSAAEGSSTLLVRSIAANGAQLDAVRLVRHTSDGTGTPGVTPWLAGGGATAALAASGAVWLSRRGRGRQPDKISGASRAE